MIASFPINTPLLLSQRERCVLVSWIEGATLGEALKGIRADWGRGTPGYLSQLKMANKLKELHGKYAPSQGTISNIENDLTPIFDLQPDVRLSFLRLYPIGDREIETLNERFELNLPGYTQVTPDIPRNAFPATTDGPTAMHYGAVSAGILGHSKPPPKPRPVNIPTWLANRYDPADIFVLTIEGDSMTCDDIRKSMPEGTEVYFHSKLQPERGEIVAVWLEDRDFGVIKIYQPEREHTVLQSYNFKHQPIVIDERNPAKIQGVYVGESKPSPIRFDR